MKRAILPILVAAGAFLDTAARADDIQFTTLPQTVQTTVIRQTHIPSAAGVVRVVQDTNGIYAVTVRGDTGQQVVYVNDAGAIVQAPAATTVQTVKTVEPAQSTQTTQTTTQTTESQEAAVGYDQIQKDQPRYELLEKKGRKEIYLDHQTGQKVTVKRDKD